MSEPQTNLRLATFIANLQRLDAGDRARLKRSAGRPLDEATQCLGLFYRLLPYGGVAPAQEPTYWLVAVLFPLTDATNHGGFGDALRRARSPRYRKGLDRRVEALLDSDPAQLPHRLAQVVRFLHSQRVPVNWRSLLEDLLQWERPNRFIQKKWARAYFSLPQQSETSTVLSIASEEAN
jgi:CRISPR system Cascade subunit CasB